MFLIKCIHLLDLKLQKIGFLHKKHLISAHKIAEVIKGIHLRG